MILSCVCINVVIFVVSCSEFQRESGRHMSGVFFIFRPIFQRKSTAYEYGFENRWISERVCLQYITMGMVTLLEENLTLSKREIFMPDKLSALKSFHVELRSTNWFDSKFSTYARYWEKKIYCLSKFYLTKTCQD